MSLQSINIAFDRDKKTSKRVLNINAIKFKLTKLHSTTIRYEVIYKNLVRDIRKFFSQDFNEVTDFIKRKRKNEKDFFINCLKSYIETRIGNQWKLMGI